MVALMKELQSWRLAERQAKDNGDSWYAYQYDEAGETFGLTLRQEGRRWRLLAGGGPDAGGTETVARDFDEARSLAYSFMDAFRYDGGSGYHCVCDAADRAGWR